MTTEHAWVLEQIARDEQVARAMSHGIMHVESRWSVSRLLTDCAARRRMAVRHEPIVASVYTAKPGFPEILHFPAPED